MFALQVARTGRIGEYEEARGLWWEIAARADEEWAPYLSTYKLCRELDTLARKR